MLTDYHVHLRPDEPETQFEKYFTEANYARYRDAASELGITDLGVSEHVYRFEQSLDVWDHKLWRENAVDDLDEYVRFVREETDLKLGIEMDYIPGREDRIANLLDAYDWDYVLGSVHFIGDAAVDHPDYDIWKSGQSPETIWQKYFESLAQAAGSGLFDILAHPDLVKVWGSATPWPECDPRFFYEPAVEAIAGVGVAVEVSTAGLRKPVGELYPSSALLEMCIDAGAPIALSSDAHTPEHVGYAYDKAQEFLAEQGITELAVFERRERRLEPVGG